MTDASMVSYDIDGAVIVVTIERPEVSKEIGKLFGGETSLSKNGVERTHR